MDLSERFKELKEKQDILLKRKMEAEVRINSLEKDIKNDLKELQEKYKVSSLEEAKKLYISQEKELQEKLKEIDAKLSSYEESINKADGLND